MKATVEKLREQMDASLMQVPFHRHLELSIVRDEATGSPSVLMPSRQEALGPGGRHSEAALFSAAEVAAGICLGDELIPIALEMDSGAIFLTVGASFRPAGPAYGQVEARAEIVNGFEQLEGKAKRPNKVRVEISSTVTTESGEAAAQQNTSYYVRFMEISRIRALAPESSELVRVLES